MRKSTLFLLTICLLSTLFFLSVLDTLLGQGDASSKIKLMQAQVHDYELTDLSLFTEARYTRHPSQADGFTPFQDHPMAFEHFPSGSLLIPPVLLRAP